MGKHSYDIDIAIDDMTGEQFATLLQEKMYPDLEKRKFNVIKASSEKSKHLETATMKLHGQQIDIVNLRHEEYTSDSRHPTIRYGTPKEDAERRDLTINALFYNINQGIVEDFTGKGIVDLKEGIIRTPLDPL